MRALPLISAAALTASLLVSSPAHAASVRFASPGGTGAACSQASPCSFKTAVEGASDGDTVQLSADEYPLTEQVQILANNLTIAGPAGVTAPGDFLAFLIFKEESEGGVPNTSPKLLIFGDNAHLQRLAITGRADGSANLVGSGSGATGAVYDRLYVQNSGTGGALFGSNATLTNSLVQQTNPTEGWAVTLSGSITGTTIYSRSGWGLWLPNSYLRAPHCSVTIRNTLAWGGRRTLLIDDTAAGPLLCPTVSADYDYSWVPTSGTGGGIEVLGAGTAIAGSHNLANTPLIFDPTNPADTYLSDLVLAPDSPAINAGCTASCSDHDYYGRPRPIGSANDIGAREQSVRPTSTTVAASSVTTSAATLSASVTPGGTTTTYALQVRPAAGAGWTSAATGTVSTSVFDSTAVTAELSGLTAATDYEARLTAMNDRGSWTSAVSTFHTRSAPRPTATVTGLRAKVTKRKAVLRSTVTVSSAGTISQSVTTGTGSRKRTRCTTRLVATAAGSYPLKCVLDGSARSKLRRTSLKTTVTTTLATSGDAVMKTSRLTIARKR